MSNNLINPSSGPAHAQGLLLHKQKKIVAEQKSNFCIKAYSGAEQKSSFCIKAYSGVEQKSNFCIKKIFGLQAKIELLYHYLREKKADNEETGVLIDIMHANVDYLPRKAIASQKK